VAGPIRLQGKGALYSTCHISASPPSLSLVSHSLSHSHTQSLTLTLSLSRFRSLSLSAIAHSLCLCLCRSVSLSISLSVSVAFSVPLCFSVSLSLPLSLCRQFCAAALGARTTHISHDPASFFVWVISGAEAGGSIAVACPGAAVDARGVVVVRSCMNKNE
jgi:hypothetical protein